MNNHQGLSLSQAKAQLASILESEPGVQGVGIGADEARNPAIVVFVRNLGDRASVPKTHQGYRVIAKVVGLMVASH